MLTQKGDAGPSQVAALAAVLCACEEGGASAGFLAPLRRNLFSPRRAAQPAASRGNRQIAGSAGRTGPGCGSSTDGGDTELCAGGGQEPAGAGHGGGRGCGAAGWEVRVEQSRRDSALCDVPGRVPLRHCCVLEMVTLRRAPRGWQRGEFRYTGFNRMTSPAAHSDRVGKYGGVPDLAVEILSEGTAYKDREIKKSEYARAGVEE